MSSTMINPIQLAQINNIAALPNQLRVDLKSSLNVKNKKLALGYLGIYYSWRNITTAFANRTFGYIWNSVKYPIILDEGFLGLSDINNILQATMIANGHFVLDKNAQPLTFLSMVTNTPYYKFEVLSNIVQVPALGSNPNNITWFGQTPQLAFDNSNFNLLLGFNSNTLYPTTPLSISYSVLSPNVPVISPVTAVNVLCDFVYNVNSGSPQTIYTFSPQVGYGKYISISPPYLTFYNVMDNLYNSIMISFTDQNNLPLAVIDSQIIATLLLDEK